MVDAAKIEELRPCPMCGGRAELQDMTSEPDWKRVRCVDCTISTGVSTDPQSVIAAWNRRASLAERGEERERADAEDGHQKLWGWFGLTRANFLTLPRVLMHAMPDEWQSRMAALLNEFENAWGNAPIGKTTVINTRNGKFAKWPEALTNYRHPRHDDLEAFRTAPPAAQLGGSDD